MNNILTEKEYQHFIMDRLSQDNGYVVRKATSYDRLFAMDRELLFQFLNDTQPDEMAALRKIYKADLEDKDMAAVTMSLGSGEQENGDVEDMITDEIRRNGKQANVSMFAFTANGSSRINRRSNMDRGEGFYKKGLEFETF